MLGEPQCLLGWHSAGASDELTAWHHRAAQVFLAGPLQALHDKQIEIKRAVPRDQMPQPRGMMMMRPPAYGAYGAYGGGRGMHGYGAPAGFPMQGQYGQPSYGPPAYRGGGGGLHGGLGSHINTTHLGVGALASNLGGQQQPGVGIPGALGGNMPNPGGLGGYGGGGLGGGLGPGMSGAGDMGLGPQMGGPLGSMGGLGSGVGRYNLGSNPGGGGSFNMAALQRAARSRRAGPSAAQLAAGQRGRWGPRWRLRRRLLGGRPQRRALRQRWHARWRKQRPG